MTDQEQIIEIRDPEINVEEIMDRIRSRIRERRMQASERGQDYDHLVEDGTKHQAFGRFEADVYYDLRELQASSDDFWVALAMRDRHFPLLNPILYRIEELLHRLALKYVNMLAGRQVVVNRATTHVLSEVVRSFDESAKRSEGLEAQVTELRGRLEKIEKILKTSD